LYRIVLFARSAPRAAKPWETPASIAQVVDLPAYTVHKIQNDRDSPQYDAFQWLKNDPNLEDYPDWKRRQRFALAALYYSTHEHDKDEGWHRKEGWLDYDRDECEWYISPIESTYLDVAGVTQPCAGDAVSSRRQFLAEGVDVGHYEHLWLVDNNLKGPLPPEIALLTHLQSIDFENNSLIGSAPPEISGLQQLQHVSFANNNFTGTLNKYMGRLSSLRLLRLEGNSITGSIPPEWRHLESLEILDLESNALVGILPSEIGLLQNLTVSH
jgi:Leucine rich repeat